MYSWHAGTINSWVVIFILPINSALNPILYTLTTSFFREQVELLLCRWQRSSSIVKACKSLTVQSTWNLPGMRSTIQKANCPGSPIQTWMPDMADGLEKCWPHHHYHPHSMGTEGCTAENTKWDSWSRLLESGFYIAAWI